MEVELLWEEKEGLENGMMRSPPRGYSDQIRLKLTESDQILTNSDRIRPNPTESDQIRANPTESDQINRIYRKSKSDQIRPNPSESDQIRRSDSVGVASGRGPIMQEKRKLSKHESIIQMTNIYKSKRMSKTL